MVVTYEWVVVQAPYEDLQATLNSLNNDDGLEIFEIIPHRLGKDVVAEVVARRSNQPA